MFKNYVQIVKELKERQEGATMVEYGLMLALIAVVAMAGVQLVGTDALALFNNIAAAL